jgi:hypothetical protein
VADNNTAENPEQKSIFDFSLRGITALIGAWQLAWGFFIRNFEEPFTSWITRKATTEADLLPEVGLVVMVAGSICLLLAAYPIRYRALYVFVVLALLSVAALFYTGIFAAYQTKQLLFHVIINYGMASVILLWIAWKAQIASKLLKPAG